ncbi:hypothetical protein EXIGLDRAFT_847885 [Exidia glandulosa HHB12029]|uniref:Uncharacterized protein n=1 Tax=Exidia glandulosa HHB12029 TaxID=1314781 RepID=A0A166MF19_EXIGL|nr:hypothetical protein EXIGLDRAFT_847885 [Exidia glandulosa HHB12029]
MTQPIDVHVETRRSEEHEFPMISTARSSAHPASAKCIAAWTPSDSLDRLTKCAELEKASKQFKFVNIADHTQSSPTAEFAPCSSRLFPLSVKRHIRNTVERAAAY